VKDLMLTGLRKEFSTPAGGTVIAVNDVNLEAEKGQLVTLLGPSGCGKTTLLRMIAGFEEPTRGSVSFGGRNVTQLPPNARDAAMVFQSYAIFPHLNVYDNVAFGLKLKRLPAAVIRERVERVLELTGLGGHAQRPPNQLSGGQQQRVALARCIVTEPQLLLFDEPLSNLDAKLREQMRIEIRDLQQRLGITTVYVTHDQIEAMSMSDLVVVMNSGNVEQVGPPEEIYARPANRFIADFIGKANFVSARVVDADTVLIGSQPVSVLPHVQPAGSTVTVVLRPEALQLDRSGGMFRATVLRTIFLGSLAECTVELADGLGTWLVDLGNPVAFGAPLAGETLFVTPTPRVAAILVE
jgi:iron(III) transport system ATP-binding protein